MIKKVCMASTCGSIAAFKFKKSFSQKSCCLPLTKRCFIPHYLCMLHTIQCTAMIQMTCELISIAVTKCRNNAFWGWAEVFPPQRSHCWFDQWVGWLEKLCLWHRGGNWVQRLHIVLVNKQGTIFLLFFKTKLKKWGLFLTAESQLRCWGFRIWKA